MSDTTVPLSGEAADRTVPTDRPEAPPGFELLDEVGRGGMGVVYRARDLTLDRVVAVKFLQERFALDSPAAARFVDEAHVTGQLQHPGVPAVHQAGALAGGRPFLVMKLIKGDTLEELLNRNAAVDPLAIFQAVAQTVGYAHAHGVIHRDLKPANVMVGNFGEAQLMDWGLAKVLPSSDGSKAAPKPADDPEATAAPTRIHTPREPDGFRSMAGGALGTPKYMSPEQAAGEIDKVDARSDVFGLGAILCVLLTGKPPFGGRDSEDVRLNAVRGRTDEAFARLDASGADPDVVALCKRCLAFEPSERPATGDVVAAEAAALRRAADERARRAERDRHAAEARAEEQAKRRRALAWAAGVVVAALLLGVLGTGIGLYRAERARAAETRQRELAEAKEAEANAVVKFFEDHVFAAGRPKGQDGGLGIDVSLRDAVLAALPTLDEAFPNQPLVEARLRAALGATFLYLGEAKQAAEQLERARTLFARHHGPDHPDTLMSMHNLAGSYFALGRLDEALKLREETLTARRRVLGADHRDTLASMDGLALSFDSLGRLDEALKLREELLTARRRVLGADHPDALMSMHNLANSYHALGRLDETLKLREETLEARRRVLEADHPDTLKAMQNLALSYATLGRRQEALKLREETLAARLRVLPPDHPDTLWSMNNVANSYDEVGRREEALKLREETLATQRRVLPPDHPDTIWSMSGLAASYAGLGRREEALKLREETLAARLRVQGPDHPYTLGSMSSLALSLDEVGRREEAMKLREEALAARRRRLPSDHPATLVCMGSLAVSYAALGRHEEALKLHEEALTAQRRVLPSGHPSILWSMWGVAASLIALNRGAEAIPLIDECVAKAAGKAVDPQLVPRVMYLRLGHFQKAGDAEGCRTTAAMWEGLDRADADSLYDAACMRAVAATTRTKVGGADAERLAGEDADRAMEWLTKAVAAGFADKAHMEMDADLDALRDRDDFKTLLAGMK